MMNSLLQQLAADQLDLGKNKQALAGLGFLAGGRQFENNIHDTIDDRIDAVSRGMMALSVSCARCHDHKYDPIPTRDYYSLHGVFASSVEPDELPVLGIAPESTGLRGVFGETQATRRRSGMTSSASKRPRSSSSTAS